MAFELLVFHYVAGVITGLALGLFVVPELAHIWFRHGGSERER